MANVNQVNTILTAASKQAFGNEAINVIDLSTFAALGDFVLKSDTNKSLFTNALMDVIGRTLIGIRPYEAESRDTVRHAFDYGMLLRKIYIGMPEYRENGSWEIGKEGFKAVFGEITKPDVKEHLFNNMNTGEIAVTIPDDLYRTAFHSPMEMAVYIEGIFVAMENRMQVTYEIMGDLCRASFIARKIHAANSLTSINLLHEYNTLTNEGLTVQKALMTPDFLRWAGFTINLWRKRMQRMSVLFNEAGYQRHTPSSEANLVLLDEFAESLTVFMQSDVFHDTLVELQGFSTVPYWQGAGTDYSFESTSKINVKLSDETTVVQGGIIGVLYDWQALGSMIDAPRTVTERVDRYEFTNYIYKFNKGYFNDMSENGIVFYIAEA